MTYARLENQLSHKAFNVSLVKYYTFENNQWILQIKVLHYMFIIFEVNVFKVERFIRSCNINSFKILKRSEKKVLFDQNLRKAHPEIRFTQNDYYINFFCFDKKKKEISFTIHSQSLKKLHTRQLWAGVDLWFFATQL